MNSRFLIVGLLLLATVTTLFWGIPVLVRRAHAQEALLNLARLRWDFKVSEAGQPARS